MKDSTLDILAPLLDALRGYSVLDEIRPATFHLKGREFIHFHETPAGVDADVRLSKGLVKMPVATSVEQAELLERIEPLLSSSESHGTRRGRRGRRGARPIEGVLLVVAVSSCSGTAVEDRTAVEASDSAGVSIVFARITEDAPTCGVTGETLRIGSVDEAQGTTLYLVNGAAILSDGRIAVVNRGSAQVKVFSPSGNLLNEFGREGPGPAEFKNLWSVHLRGTDTLVIGDYRPWRFSFFTPEGELLRRVELKPAVIGRPDFAIPLEPGAGFVMEEPSFQIQDEMVDRVVPLRVFGQDGEEIGAVGDFWLDRFGYQAKEIGYVGNPIFGAKATFSHLRDDLVLYGTGRSEQLEIWNIAGELQGIVRWESRAREVAPADVDVWRRQRRADMEGRSNITPQIERAIEAQIGEHLPVADLYPGHDQVVVSQEGRIWVEEYRRPLDEGSARWWVFGTDQRFLCSASLPRDLTVLAVGGNRVLGLVRDSLNVEYVLGYDVEYPSGPGQ